MAHHLIHLYKYLYLATKTHHPYLSLSSPFIKSKTLANVPAISFIIYPLDGVVVAALLEIIDGPKPSPSIHASPHVMLCISKM